VLGRGRGIGPSFSGLNPRSATASPSQGSGLHTLTMEPLAPEQLPELFKATVTGFQVARMSRRGGSLLVLEASFNWSLARALTGMGSPS
jgi:hypothetical protein